MKLILCTKCSDIVKLIENEYRECQCGNVRGKYTDELNAVFTAKSESYALIGFENNSLLKALVQKTQEEKGFIDPLGTGILFDAFLIREDECDTIKRE